MKHKRLVIAGTICLALIGGAALLGPRFASQYVEDEVRQRLNSAGIDASWDEFSAGFGRTFAFHGLRVKDPRRGLDATIKTVEITLSVEDWQSKTVRVDNLEIQGAQVRLDIREDEAGAEAGGSASPSLRETVKRYLIEPPDVQVRQAQLTVLLEGSETLRVGTDETTFELDWNSAAASGDVDIEVLHPEAKRWAKPVAANFSGSWDETTGDAVADIASEAGPLLAWNDKELGGFTLGKIHVEANTSRAKGYVTIDAFHARVGHVDAPAVAVEAPTVVLGWDGRPTVELRSALVELTPSKRAALERLVSLKTGKPTASATHVVSPTKTSGRIAKAMTQVSKWLNATDLRVRDGQINVNLPEDDTDAFTTLTLLEQVHANVDSGHVLVHAASAGGRVFGELDFVPGDPIPRFAEIKLEKVRLDQIPGMPEGRSELPNRGTSGRVGGEFSAGLSWQLPTLGARLSPPWAAGHGKFSVEWRQGVIDLVGVSEEPLEGIAFATSGEFKWAPLLAEVKLTNGKVKIGAVDIDYSAFVEDFPLDPAFGIKAKMAKVDCQKAFRSIPAGMLGPYRNIEFEGEWEPSVEFYLPINRPRALKLEFYDYEDVCTPLALKVPKLMRPDDIEVLAAAPTGPHKTIVPVEIEGPALADVDWLNRPFVKKISSEFLSSEEIEVVVGPGTSTYVPLEAMPSYVGGAAFLSEEMMFYTDPAISLSLIKKALRLNLEQGRFVYGGSTVTQQLVKNLFLTRDKTLARKLQEALVSWRITQMISKDRVLELYLNCIEFGPDLYGIGPAAKFYFQKDARYLSPLEAIFLAMLKPYPAYGPRVIQRKKTPDGGWWSNRMEEMFQRLVDRGMITKEQADAQRPYVLEWDAKGRYIDRNPRIPFLAP